MKEETIFLSSAKALMEDIVMCMARTCKPWKLNKDTEYAKGWNDCVKEMGKRHKQFLVNIKKAGK